MSEKRIPLSEPLIGGNASRYSQDCLDTNFVSSVGPYVDRFEQEFAAFVGSRFAVACASGTAALHVAFRLLGVTSGDEIVVPTLTFVASANPVVYQGATPLLVDAELTTWNMDPQLVVEEVERRAKRGLRLPRAIEIVHILGHPASIESLTALSEKHGIPLVEDASESLGAQWLGGPYAGRQVGTVGRIGCFSFNGNKVITTGGGGMLTTDDESLARRAKHLTTQARIPGLEYRHDEVGYNYRLSNLSAALGVAQLEELPTLLEKKRAIAGRYDKALSGVSGIDLSPKVPWAASSSWLYSILVQGDRFGCESRDLIAKLALQGVDSRPLWTPLHMMEIYRTAPRLGGKVAETLFSKGASLPSSSSLTLKDQERVSEAIRQIGASARVSS